MLRRRMTQLHTQFAKRYSNLTKPVVSPLKLLSLTLLGFTGGYAYAQRKSISTTIQTPVLTVPQNIYKALQPSATQIEKILLEEEKNYDKVRIELQSMKLLLTKEQIKRSVQAMGDQIAKQFQNEKHLLALTLLQGANYFANDLIVFPEEAQQQHGYRP